MNIPDSSFLLGGTTPLDRRYQLASQAVGVAENGVGITAAKVIGGANVITSTGAIGPYTINFSPIVYAAAPCVVAWCSKESGGNPILMNLDSVGTTSFTFDMIIPASSAAVNVGHTVTVEWIAVGS